MRLDELRLSHISPACLRRVLLCRLWAIAAAAVICAMGAFFMFSLENPARYRAEMTYAVEADQTLPDPYAAARQVDAVLTQLLRSDAVTQSLRADAGTSLAALRTARVAESNLIVVTADGKTPADAIDTLRALQATLPDILRYVNLNATIDVIREPSVAAIPELRAKLLRSTMIAATLGALAAAMLLCWQSLRRGTIRTRTAARELLDAPILACIGDARTPETDAAFTEQIRFLCAALLHEHDRYGSRSFVFTATHTHEGTSTIAAHTAAMLTKLGKKTALLHDLNAIPADADLLILDAPALTTSAEVEALAEKADASMLVVRRDCATAEDIQKSIHSLPHLLGIVLNEMPHCFSEGIDRN